MQKHRRDCGFSIQDYVNVAIVEARATSIASAICVHIERIVSKVRIVDFACNPLVCDFKEYSFTHFGKVFTFELYMETT